MTRSKDRDNTRSRSREKNNARDRSRERTRTSGKERRARSRDRRDSKTKEVSREKRDRSSEGHLLHGAHGSHYKAVPECDADPGNDIEWETFCGTEIGSKLVQCCRDGDIEEVTRLLDERPERLHEPERQLSFCCEHDYIELTPLHAAVISKRRAVAKLLVQRGVDLNLRSQHFSNTALDVAIANGTYNLVKVLVMSGADLTSPHPITNHTPARTLLIPTVNYLVKGSKIPLMSWARCVDILTLLIKNGCQLQPAEQVLAMQVVEALQNYDDHTHAQAVAAENRGLHPTSSRIVKHVSGKEARKLGQSLLDALSLGAS